MVKVLLYTLLLLTLSIPSFSFQDIQKQEIGVESSELPIIVINTANKEIRNDPKTEATIRIIDNATGKRNKLNDPAFECLEKKKMEWKG